MPIEIDQLKLLTVKDDYIKFLYTIDHRVCYNKTQHRSYVGIAFQYNEFSYFAPLTSFSEEKRYLLGRDYNRLIVPLRLRGKFWQLHE